MMKNVSCDLCSTTFPATTFEEWFKAMHGHYMADHADFMEASKDKSPEEGMRWMEAAKKRFEEAPEMS